MTFFFFFFQAEDGIRDKLVTGVQTCALPISGRASSPESCRRRLWVAGPRPRRGPYRPCATAQTCRCPVRLQVPPASYKIDSYLRVPSPKLVVVPVVQRQVATAHRLFNDAAGLPKG